MPNTYRAFYGAFAVLRPFQRQVMAPILQGQDLILQAATGSGNLYVGHDGNVYPRPA